MEGNRFAAADRLKLGRPEYKDAESVRKALRKQAFESAFAWDRNGRLVAARDGTSRRVTLFDFELEEASFGSIIHNHPNGVPFSLDDLNTAKKFSIKHLEIVSKRYDYILEPPDAGWDRVSDTIWNIEMEELRIRQRNIYKDLNYGTITHEEVFEELHEAMKEFRMNARIRYGRIEG